jgi:ribosomal protein S18 acetylase RimI-like enzyme
MMVTAKPVLVRRFKEADADTCFRIRSEAFIVEFQSFLAPEAVAAAVNAYLPADYVAMAARSPFFVATVSGRVVGFLVLRVSDGEEAELFLVYVERASLRRGIGRHLALVADDWLRANRPDVTSLVVDTVIPSYNRGFYERLGYEACGERQYAFPGQQVRALRLRRPLTLQRSTGYAQEE